MAEFMFALLNPLRGAGFSALLVGSDVRNVRYKQRCKDVLLKSLIFSARRSALPLVPIPDRANEEHSNAGTDNY